MKYFVLIFLLFVCSVSFSKTIIKGKVSDKNGALIGANVSIKGTYDGATSKAGGEFEFKTLKKGSAELVVKYVGYHEFIKQIELNDSTIIIEVKLREKMLRTDVVSVSAGSIEATDEKKSVVFSSLDVVSTAGTGADIVSAFQTLPGVSKVGESGGLFVRGGEGRETTVFIDGIEVKHPFYSKVPDLASRGRLSPFLFKGTYFSTGGYSAEFGKGLSSAMILNSTDLPDYSFTHIDIMPLAVGFGHTHRSENWSVGADFAYSNLKWYFDMNPQDQIWDTAPIGYEGTITARYKTSESGMLKLLTYICYDEMAMRYKDIDNNLRLSDYSGKNFSLITNLSHKELLSEKWIINSAVSYAVNSEKTEYNTIPITELDNQIMAKTKLSFYFDEISTLNFGAEISNYHYKDEYQYFDRTLTNNLSAIFIEPEFGLSKDLVIRTGIRSEYCSLNDKLNIAPRLSAAYRLSQNGTLSFACGRYYQLPDKEYMTYNNRMNFELADHYILNYQLMQEKRIFRAEVYYKKYDNLTTTTTGYTNDGYGDAKGIELFWRDKESIENFDYWVSYSFLDTKRKFMNYPVSVTPDFAVGNSFSVVAKKYFPSLSMSLSATYSFAEGRKYNDPMSTTFMNGKVKNYNDLSLSAYYITQMFGAFAVFVVSCDNVLGFDNVYNVKFSADGQQRLELRPPTLRNIFFGIFLSFGRDNTDDY